MHTSTILIIDDEPIGRESLEALLMADGYRVVGAGSGAEGLAKAAKLVPDVIVLDVMMPAMDGFAVCRHLRADALLADVPIIMLTALDDRRSRIRGLEAGADDFISKPFDRVELEARIRTITRLNRYRRLLVERAKFEWVVEEADDGYLLISEDDAVLYANAQARRYLSMPRDASSRVTQSFHALAARNFTCEPQRAWATWPQSPTPGMPVPRYLVRPETPATVAFWLQVDALHLPGGAGAGWLVSLRDVTTRMTAQRDMWKLHAMVSHKLRTPLVGMVNSTQLLAQRTSQLSAHEMAHYAETALRNSLRLQSSVNDIVKFMEAPNLAQQTDGFTVKFIQPLLADIAALNGIESADVRCQTRIETEQLALSHQAVTTIFQEIVENAKKFHPRQSPTLEVNICSPRPNEVSIVVSDDGVTLSPEQLHKACVPYYQGEKYFTGESAGMGLGLAMVAALLWSIGGTCTLTNRADGPGVVVTMVVPLAKPAEMRRGA